MTKAKWKKLVATARKEMLTDPDKLTPRKRAAWYAGMGRLLTEIRRTQERSSK